MIGNLTAQQIRDRLDNDDQSSITLSKIVCSEYWNQKPYSRNDLYSLDADSLELAKAIMNDRMKPERNDAEIHALACWCRIRHNLTQWSHCE